MLFVGVELVQGKGAVENRIEDGVVAIADIRHGDLWLYNDLDDKTKLIIASAASIMLLRKEYVEWSGNKVAVDFEIFATDYAD